jgi:hypothetical protein
VTADTANGRKRPGTRGRHKRPRPYGRAHPLAARELLQFKNGVSNVDLVVEHEYPDAHVQDARKLSPILKGSIAFTRAVRRGRIERRQAA